MSTKESIVKSIQHAALDLNTASLRFSDYHKLTGISNQDVLKHFDSWSDACKSAGVACGPTGKTNLRRAPFVTNDECIAELRRVAKLLNKDTLSREEFTEHSKMSSITPRRRFGGWPQALEAAGLKLTTFTFPDNVPIDSLVPDFLSATIELGKIPSLHQLSRRSKYGKYLFSVKHGGYAEFKRQAIQAISSGNEKLPPDILALLREEHNRLNPPQETNASPARAHQHGRVLGFRAFAFQPTYEMEVVSLFSTVAGELGFEIICQRGEYPDCEAQRRLPGNRKRYAKCLIEFELRSSDFRVHRHPINGCDLIVCWEHDWSDCPLEVLELKKAIKSLPGWQ